MATLVIGCEMSYLARRRSSAEGFGNDVSFQGRDRPRPLQRLYTFHIALSLPLPFLPSPLRSYLQAVNVEHFPSPTAPTQYPLHPLY